MFDRRALAALILGVWIAALGWHARRELFPSAADRLALGFRTLPPGVAYYAVFSGERRAGWGQTEVDTLPGGTGLRVRERLQVELPGLAATGLERSSEEYLDAGLHLDSLTRLSIVASDTSRLEVRVLGDTAVSVRFGGSATDEVLALPGPVTTDAGWRLRLAAAGGGDPGDRFRLDVFDPAAGVSRPVELSVLEVGSISFADSADTDSISGEWLSVREDTVSAWRVGQSAGAVTLEAWVDEDGRLVDGDVPGGYRVERTAFELAFFTRPGAGADVASPDRTDDARSGDPE